MDIIQTLAQELDKKPQYVENVVRLLDEGNTIPFIARYRKELHGAMDDTSLRTLEERLQYLRGLEERREAVKNAIEEQGKLTAELTAAIDRAKTLAEVEDLYRPYKQKRRTRATAAKEKGLEPLAALLFAQERNCPRPEEAAQGFIDPEKGVETIADALQGANDIIAEWISDDAAVRKSLRELLERGVQNGVEGLEILDRAALRALEPAVSDKAVAALWAPTGAVLCPFGMTIALAENAAANGCAFRFNTEVARIERRDGFFRLHTGGDCIDTRVVISAAGVYGDALHNQLCADKLTIVPRRGEYCLLDRTCGQLVQHTIFQLPSAMGKGVLVTPTVHGNLLVGPTAVDQPDKDRTATTAEGLRSVAETAVCMMVLCVLHFPCGTTCLTIRRETGSWRWTALAALLPTAMGMALCMAIHGLWTLLT